MKHIGDVIDRNNSVNKLNSPTVNSNDKSIPTVNSIITVNSYKSVGEKIDEFLETEGITPQGVAQKLAEDLDDEKSYSYYLILAKEHKPGKLLEACSITQDAYRNNKIRTNKAVYFQAILRKWNMKTKFKH